MEDFYLLTPNHCAKCRWILEVLFQLVKGASGLNEDLGANNNETTLFVVSLQEPMELIIFPIITRTILLCSQENRRIGHSLGLADVIKKIKESSRTVTESFLHTLEERGKHYLCDKQEELLVQSIEISHPLVLRPLFFTFSWYLILLYYIFYHFKKFLHR